MRRREPPPLATWMLEHLTPDDRNEALAGDLLEVFRAGNSDRWYWRQAIAACAVAWWRSLEARGPALAFALVWSILAPVWKVTIDRVGDPLSAWTNLGPLWILFALAGWIVYHAAFLWAGLLVYRLASSILGNTARQMNMRRALSLAPLIFAPVAGFTFVLAKLYWYSIPGLAEAKLASAYVGQMADLGVLPDLIRIPCFIALAGALWAAIPRTTGAALLVESSFGESPTKIEARVLASDLDPYAVKRFLVLVVAAGLINAMLVSVLLCRLPQPRVSSLAALFVPAVMYLLASSFAGIAGSWLYWRNPSSPFRERAPLPFSVFALVCAAGWVWVPAMVIFSEQLSAATAFIAASGAFVLASGLRGATNFVFASAGNSTAILDANDAELFAESLARPPVDAHGYVIAISLYAAGCALAVRWNYTAATCLALSASLFAWNKAVPTASTFAGDRTYSNAASRLARFAIPAVLVTMWALLYGVANRDRVERANAALNHNSTAASGDAAQKRGAYASALDGYQSIVLWPEPPKKEILAPLPPRPLPDAHLARPLVIRFNGAYWYFQPPSDRPGPHAHVAHGSPLAADIHSTTFIPLTMEAHQTLAAPVRLSCCREIRVEIANRDNRPGLIAMAMRLNHNAAPGKPSLFFAPQPIQSSQPGRFTQKTEPVEETVRFTLPARPAIQRFDEITLILLSDPSRIDTGPQIAVEQFELMPR